MHTTPPTPFSIFWIGLLFAIVGGARPRTQRRDVGEPGRPEGSKAAQKILHVDSVRGAPHHQLQYHLLRSDAAGPVRLSYEKEQKGTHKQMTNNNNSY